ncbi:MAG: hypothetical protein N3E50_02985 [Candidatus Goldbacteria bacterium]|nr:hypothetical protein [Candidatus Goldiibacteriota bacterium]
MIIKWWKKKLIGNSGQHEKVSCKFQFASENNSELHIQDINILGLNPYCDFVFAERDGLKDYIKKIKYRRSLN